MEVRILRRREVERLTRLSKASIYRKMRSGTFPLPFKLGERAVACRAAMPIAGAALQAGSARLGQRRRLC